LYAHLLTEGVGTFQALRIDERGAQQATGFSMRRLAAQRMPATISGSVCRTEHLPAPTKELAMQNGRKAIMSARRPRSGSFAARSKRPEPKGSQNAQRNYERYLALARAETQIGNTIGAETYYQYAEHYFRSMASDAEVR
jgi:uncharacterized protein DUF4167